MKKVLVLVLALIMGLSLCACGGSSSGSGGSSSKSVEDQVRSAVQTRGNFAYFGKTIGGNELKSSRVTITNLKEVSDTEYLVSGKVVMTDVYGTQWNNTFDCEVKNTGDSWSAGQLEFTSDNWTK